MEIDFEENYNWELVKKRIEASSFRHKRLKSVLTISSIAALIFVVYLPLSNYFSGSTARDTGSASLHVGKGGFSRINLPDGSLVILNAESRLTYSPSFGETDREVILEGEGFFYVEKSENFPFRVKTGTHTIEVLGTQFNVRNYPDEKELEVTLQKGSIHLNEENITMVPNQHFIFNKETATGKITHADVSDYIGWIEGRFICNDLTLAEICRRLERKFNVDITIRNDRLKQERFYGVFRNNENLQEILDIIALDKKIHYTIRNNELNLFYN
jgi:Fe2+-dicitrate sensor, membrane component